MRGESVRSSPIDGSTNVSSCIPIVGTSRYRCKCVKPFREDVTLGYQNCAARSGACDYLICVHGTCLTSLDYSSSACICDPGWDGEICDKRVGLWLPLTTLEV
ncbi:unnamed protein product [Protopolystoma xenopodis]|uniref:EGF-like domain-containing protein n=1 Tax=Protopolystoma xenopodis TaxID=117903 RepID=A0A448WL54_9PLAT|nr:unnamed protein product [Protopolystoma xenopodis]